MTAARMDVDRLSRAERERLRAAATRNLVECCEDCRALLREQLEREEFDSKQ